MNGLGPAAGTALRVLSVLAAAYAAYSIFVIHGPGHIVSEAWADQNVRGQGPGGILLYVGMTTMLTAFGVPRQLCSFLGGYVFGLWYGTLWATLGTGLACLLCFGYARFLGREWVYRRFGPRMAAFNAFICRSPFTLTLLVRIAPLGSNFLTNFFAGVSPIPALPFLSGSLAGFTIQNFIFAALGSGLQMTDGWRTACGALLYAASLCLGIAAYRRYQVGTPVKEK